MGLFKNNSKTVSLIAVMLAFLLSCSKKEVVPIVSSSLLGSWTLVSIGTTGCTDPQDNEAVTNCTTCPTISFTETIFTTNETGTVQKSSYTVSGNMINNSIIFSVVGPKLTLTIPGTADNGNCQTDLVYKLNS